MTTLLHLGSLALGLLSWGLGFAAISRKGRPVLIFSGMAACAAALLFQLLEIRHLAELMDASAIYDTIGAVTFAAGVLLTVTLVLNGIALLRRAAGTKAA